MFCFTDLLIKQTISHHPCCGRSSLPRPRHLAPGPPGPWSVSPVRTSGGKINTWAGDCLWSPAPTLTTGGAPGGWHVTLATIRVAISSHLWSPSWSPNTSSGAFSECEGRCTLCLLCAHCPLGEPAGHIWRHPVTSQHSNIRHRLEQCYVPQARRYQRTIKHSRSMKNCLRKMRNISPLCLCSTDDLSISSGEKFYSVFWR